MDEISYLSKLRHSKNFFSMAKQHKPPGVYIEETSAFPSSIAAVETAIPAFIGYTEKAKEKSGDDLRMKPFKVRSLLEFEQFYGKPQPETNILVTVNQPSDKSASWQFTADFDGPRSGHILHYALQAYFANGGGPCYIVSVGSYLSIGTPLGARLLRQGLKMAESIDEVTLLLMPESRSVGSISEFAALNNAALAQCAKLQDRFALLDVFHHTGNVGQDIESFRRDGVGSAHLEHGAAYYPLLEAVFDYAYREEDVRIRHLVDGQSGGASDGHTLAKVYVENPIIYTPACKAIQQLPCLLPPSAFMVGVYALVDASRGVWKAPANVSLGSVLKPSAAITNEEQETMNVDALSGKSVNAIRAFIGQGTLVWGARTLAGNDNEWRYISVRRFHNMIHESVRKALAAFVFEPNDANTWAKVRAMIENFLTDQWRHGALAGATPNESYFVKVGLGQTMSSQDLLDGRLIVEIGMAVMRPAEFIVLRITQKMS